MHLLPEVRKKNLYLNCEGRRKSLKTLLQSAQVTRSRRRRNPTGEPRAACMEQTSFDKSNRLRYWNSRPLYFPPLLLRPERCGSHDTGRPGRGLQRGAGGTGQEAVRVT